MGQGGERMRKILPMILCLLLLGGCAKGGEPGITPEEIQARLIADCRFTAAFTYENIEGCAEVEKTGEVFSITLTEPEVLLGLSFVLGPEGSQMIYGDTVIDLQDHTIHEEALAAVMERAFAGADVLTVTRQNGHITATADCTFFHYEVTLSEDTGYPTGISVPELNIEIAITDYTPAAGV